MIITGVVLAALLNTANAQFAIENNSKLGAKVENVSETTKQASPATYEIQQDGSQYFITTASKRLYIDYDPAKDVLNISSLGDYLRN